MAVFVERTEGPDSSNAYYFRDNVFYQWGYGMPNCTCYAYGRFWEVIGKEPNLSDGNACDWWGYNISQGAYSYGQTPKLGAIVCWSGGSYGHVCVVERINSDQSIVVSGSNYSGDYWYTWELDPPSYYIGAGYSLQGFIYPDIDFTNGATSNNSSSGSNLNSAPRTMTTTAQPQFIWEFLIQRINNPYGVAGLMGNLYHESALSAINLQGSYEDYLGYSDTSYTQAVDNGSYSSSKFIDDEAGYGLAQWTYWSRKEKLYNYCQSKNSSIGNIITQLEFLYDELANSYPTVLSTLKNASSVLEASNSVLFDFESPANQDSWVQNTRASTGQGYYDQYKHITAEIAKQNNGTTTNTIPEEEEEQEQFVSFAIDLLFLGTIES